MEHVAIMRKSWGLTNKILSGEKTIESRWYKFKYPPWDRIKTGDVVYFKDSGEPVTMRAEVMKVLQFSNLTPQRVRKLLRDNMVADGINISDLSKFYEWCRDKKYCILVYLKNPKKIKQFDIDKTGFGMLSAWITIENVNKIRK